MALPSPPPYINPIPNNPFYSVPVYITKGAYYPITVGSGLSVDPVTAIMTSAGGGGGGVTSVTAGSGISVSASTGAVTITNTGITSIVAGSGISVSTVGGVSTITNLNNGTVTAINTGTGLTGGPILAFGTISLANTAVTPGSYSNPTLTIDAQGRITSASSGTAIQTLTASLPLTLTAGVNPTIAINPATTLACGAVLLSDSTASTSSSTAATSNALKTAYDIAIAAIPKSCITGKGALITGIGASTPVALPVGSNGQVLTACSSCVSGLYWSTPGAVTPTPNYGSFLSTLSQTIDTPGTPQPVTLNTVVAANNFTLPITNLPPTPPFGTEITAAVAGIYNLQFSIQLLANPGGSGDVEIWLSKNGSVVLNSNTRFAIKNTNEAEFAALNYVVSMNANDYLELYWSTGDVDNFLYAASAPTPLGGPAIPSVIVTIVPVGA